MKLSPRIPKPLAIVLLLLCGLPAGCRKRAESAKSAASAAAQPVAPDSGSRAAAPAAQAAPVTTSPEGPPDWIAHPQMSPGTVSLSAVDPHDMTPSERAYGRSPELSPDVEYRPGVIVMPHGDKAIKSIASDGITWTFDANAPQVSDFQVGKIVFATGRAVGKILGMTRNGNNVSVYLGPILLTDVIKRGRFVMEQPIDPDKIISYVAPDYPGTNDSTSGTKSAMLGGAGAGTEETIVVSALSHGKWTPTSMSRTDRQGSRAIYRRHGRRWALISDRHPLQGLTIPQGASRPVTLPPLDIPPTRTVNVDNGKGRIATSADRTYLGLQFYYNEPSGLSAYAGGLVTLHAPVVRCVLKFSNAGVDSAGISITGTSTIKLRLDSHSPQSAFVNLKVRKMVPLDMSIQLGGPIPFSLTFGMLFDIGSGFSAKTSVMVAEGEYNLSGGIWAGRTGSGWSIGKPSNPQIVTDFGQSLAGVSLGINSFRMSYAIRTTVGLGAFGFNTGVFAQVRFGGTLLLSPNTVYQCRQATIETFLDTGLGWAIPQWAADVINFFLGAVSAHPIDPMGTLVPVPPVRLFHGLDEIPSGCSGAKTG